MGYGLSEPKDIGEDNIKNAEQHQWPKERPGISKKRSLIANLKISTH